MKEKTNTSQKTAQTVQRFDTIYALRTPIFVTPQVCGIMVNFTGFDESEKIYYTVPEEGVILMTNKRFLINDLCNRIPETRNYIQTGKLQNRIFLFDTGNLHSQDENGPYLYLAYLVDLEIAIIARNADILEEWIRRVRNLIHRPENNT